MAGDWLTVIPGREGQRPDNRRHMDTWQVERVLKEDAFGCVELLARQGGGRLTRRVASGGRWPLSGVIARSLARRERRALAHLEGTCGAPRSVEDEAAAQVLLASGEAPRRRDVFLREWVEGVSLPLATELPEDFFDLLDDLVGELHARGVCHNDLHKEPNILVQPDGRPALVDFQLASLHPGGGASFESRVSEDDRHVHKHRTRYTSEGRGPASAGERGRGLGKKRRPLSFLWRRLGKPVYLLVTRGLLKTRDGAEEFRPSAGPWPAWTESVGKESSR